MAIAPTMSDPAYFDRLAEVEAAHWWSLGMWRLASHWLDAAIAGRSGLRALDVGCGTGLTAVRLARRPEIGRVVGIEPSPEALAHARRLDGVPLVRGSALDLPFRADRFDVVTCFDVLQHLPPGGDLRAARELFRVLGPGGVAMVRSNAACRSGIRSNGAIAYSLGGLIGLFEEAGFHVIRASYANCVPAMAEEVRGRLVAGRGRRAGAGHPAGGGLRIRMPRPWMNRIMGGVSSMEAAAAGRLGLRLPFGHSTILLAGRPGRSNS